MSYLDHPKVSRIQNGGNMWKSIVTVFCCVILVGCQTMQQQSNKTQGQMERDRVVATLNNGDAAIKSCVNGISDNKIYKRFSTTRFK